jgi:nicotinamidase/pyrazinamidase
VKHLLVVVDYQNDFILGSLGFPEAASYYGRIKALITQFSEGHDDVVFTRDVHDEKYLHTEEGRNLPIMHCLAGTDGVKFYGELEAISHDYPVFEKATFPSFELGKWLHGRDYEEIVLCGLDLSICVLSNAVICKAGCPNAHIVVDLSASGCGDAEAKDTAIKALKRLHVECRDLSKANQGYL